jgi:hypothetical protein
MHRIHPGYVCIGLHWPALACIGLHWPALACIGLHWPALACIGTDPNLRRLQAFLLYTFI